MLNSFFCLNLAESSASSIRVLGLIAYPTKMQVRSATIGIRTLLLIKSKKSRKAKPIIFTFDHTPLPKEEGNPKSTLPINT